MGIRVLLCCFLLQNTDYKNSLLFTPFSATRFAMHRIYANRINSRGMSRVFCDLRSQKTPRGISPVNSNHSVHSNVAKIHSKLPAAMELFHIFQLAYRYFIRNSLLCLIFPDPFHIFSALDTSPDQDMTANFKRRCIAGISAPADAWYVI